MLIGFGTGAVVVGGVGELVDSSTTDDPSTPTNEHFDASGWAPPLLIGGALLGAIGVVVAIASTDKPDPAQTLFNGKFAVVAAGPQPVNVMSSEHTFEQSHTGDEVADAKKQIIARMTKQFIDEIKEAKASHPVIAPQPGFQNPSVLSSV